MCFIHTDAIPRGEIKYKNASTIVLRHPWR